MFVLDKNERDYHSAEAYLGVAIWGLRPTRVDHLKEEVLIMEEAL